MKNIINKLFLIGVSMLTLISCSSDDGNEVDTTVPEFLIGAEYVYRAPNCENQESIANSCFASIAFPDKDRVDMLPFGDAIFNVNYRVEDRTLTVLFSESVVDGIDQEFIIVSEIVLLDAITEDQYIRQ